MIRKAVVLACAIAAYTPARAAVTVSTDQAAFDAAHVVTNVSFAFAQDTAALGSYTLAGVTFSGDRLFGVPSPGPSSPSVLNLQGPTLNVTSSGAILGLTLTDFANQTVSYIVNGTTSGTVSFHGSGETKFLSFDAGGAGPLSITFSGFGGDLDIGGFQIAAVPEPATWLSAVAGFGAIGVALRRRRAQAGRFRFD